MDGTSNVHTLINHATLTTTTTSLMIQTSTQLKLKQYRHPYIAAHILTIKYFFK